MTATTAGLPVAVEPRPYRHGERIEHVVARHAARHPQAVALQQGARTMTYGELVQRAETVAAALHAVGVAPGQHVAVRVPRSFDLVVALLGVLRAGAAYAAVDPQWPQQRTAETLRGGATLAITEHHRIAPLGGVRHVSLAALLRIGRTAPVPEPQSDGTATASIFYTSGSTGTPKGVLSPHRGTIRTLVDCPSIPLDSASVFLQAAPLPWDGLSLELWAPLLNGGRCVLLDDTVRSLDAEVLAAAVADGVDSLWLTSSLFNVIAEERLDLFAGLRLLLVGGERVSVTNARRAVTAFPKLRMVNGYGPSESTIFTTSHVIRPADVAEGSTEIPIGMPVPRTEVLLLGQDGRPVADGEVGEITVGGDGVAHGYLDNAEETARRFFTVAGERFYRTGDLGLRDASGLLRYRGRLDHQIKIRGVRTEPGEVEAVLETLEAVTACCVLALETVPGRVQLAAAYTTADHRPLSTDQLRQHASGQLPEAMVPTVFRYLDQLPLNSNGKADRRAVTDLLRQPADDAPGGIGCGDGAEGDAGLLAEVRALLGATGLQSRDDLLAAGMSSLDAIRLAARIGARLGTGLTASDIYQLRTVDAIVAHCAVGTAAVEELPEASAVAAIDAPLSHAQQRFWLTEMMSPGAADNMLVLAYALTGSLDPELLHRSLNDVVARHPALRTVYPWDGEAPTQRVLSPQETVLFLEQVAAPAPAGPTRTGLQELAEEVTSDWWDTPFALDQEPPFRARLCRVAEDLHLLCLHVHHIAFDGWSESVLLETLQEAYRARAEGRAPKDRQLLGYGQFSAWEATRLAQWAAADLLYWQARLSDLPQPFLPKPRGASGLGPKRQETVLQVPAETVQGLRRAAASRGGPLVSTLIAAAGRALGRTFDTRRVTVGSVTAGRFDPALEPVVGYFVNPFVVPLDDIGSAAPQPLVDQAVSTVLACLDHVRTPFDELVRTLGPARDRHPWFQTWVVLQGQPPRGRLGADVRIEPVRVRPPRTDIELMLEAFPSPDGSWELVVFWREDGLDENQAMRLVRELHISLGEIADCPD